MLEELVKLQKISAYEALTYRLFTSHDLGVKWFEIHKNAALHEVPSFDNFKEGVLGYAFGRSSIAREIDAIIKKVNLLAIEYSNENSDTNLIQPENIEA